MGQEGELFQIFIDWAEKKSVFQFLETKEKHCERNPLDSILSQVRHSLWLIASKILVLTHFKPHQRITRYGILLDPILKRTKDTQLVNLLKVTIMIFGHFFLKIFFLIFFWQYWFLKINFKYEKFTLGWPLGFLTLRQKAVCEIYHKYPHSFKIGYYRYVEKKRRFYVDGSTAGWLCTNSSKGKRLHTVYLQMWVTIFRQNASVRVGTHNLRTWCLVR